MEFNWTDKQQKKHLTKQFWALKAQTMKAEIIGFWFR